MKLFLSINVLKNISPEDEYGILWNDKTANIQWPIKEPFLSNRDMSFPALAEQDESLLPVFEVS